MDPTINRSGLPLPDAERQDAQATEQQQHGHEQRLRDAEKAAYWGTGIKTDSIEPAPSSTPPHSRHRRRRA